MTLVILAATPTCVVFQSTGPETYTATIADLDRARLRIARYGDAWIGPHSVDEADVVALHQAIRAAAERGRTDRGWLFPTDAARKAHYFRASDPSLCRRYGSIGFPAIAFDLAAYPSNDECAECRRILDAKGPL